MFISEPREEPEANSRKGRTMIFTNKIDLINEYILPALGEWAESFDVDAIADELYEWVDGQLTLVREEKFWEIAGRHELGRA